MRVLFHSLFYILVKWVVIEAEIENNKILDREVENAVAERTEKTENSEVGSFSETSDKILGGIKRRRNSELPEYPPFYLMKNPEHVGDGARLRLDFTHPAGGVNGSCPNFRGTAEVVAGPWRLPPAEMPVILLKEEPKNFDDDSDGIKLTTTKNEAPRQQMTATTTIAGSKTNKKSGLFKQIKDFFKHSLHIEKSNDSTLQSTTVAKVHKNLPELVTQKAYIQRQNLQDRFQGYGDVRKDGIYQYFNNYKKPARGRDASFNLRIKAVAVPRFLGTRKNVNSN